MSTSLNHLAGGQGAFSPFLRGSAECLRAKSGSFSTSERFGPIAVYRFRGHVGCRRRHLGCLAKLIFFLLLPLLLNKSRLST